jgi:lipopolysaccharide export system permease protein
LKSLDQYILRQLWTPFVFATIVVTAIVWLTQSLQRIDLIVEHGQTLMMFGWLTLLIIPSLLAVIIPFTLFGAALYALQRLHSDSELAVMFAAGVSRAAIARPLLLVTAFAALMTLWMNVDLMPRSYRELKREVANIRADVASAVLRSGEFTPIGKGFTVYVETAEPGGRLSGLLIHDYRKPDGPETYMAERALIEETDIGPVIHLAEGNYQRRNPRTEFIDIVHFDRLAVDLGQFSGGTGDLLLESTERYPHELFRPDLTRDWDRENAARLIAEGHSRYAAPLYAFAFALIALYAFVGGAYARRGYGVRIALACAAAGLVRVAGIVIQSVAADTGQFWLVYLPAGAAIVVAIALLGGILRLIPKRAPAPAEAEA